MRESRRSSGIRYGIIETGSWVVANWTIKPASFWRGSPNFKALGVSRMCSCEDVHSDRTPSGRLTLPRNQITDIPMHLQLQGIFRLRGNLSLMRNEKLAPVSETMLNNSASFPSDWRIGRGRRRSRGSVNERRTSSTSSGKLGRNDICVATRRGISTRCRARRNHHAAGRFVREHVGASRKR